ncbi:hypothetical protein OUZ56_033671 [Daphnia magna]|uniref:Uncharacterized protein n=1 Tax=Daphnia magna TaxID=35525 RepID=A0ABQ9ZY53_9CRUS|nr:hypothetical protein OUZ56_033671 [Daphnia magna]
MTGPTPTRSKEIIAFQGVIFKSQGEVAFSDSEWVVVTDFTFDPVVRMIKTLFDLLDGKVGAMTYQYDGPEDKFKKALQHQVELRARLNLEKLKTSHRRLNELKAAVSSEGARTKRALVDGGGKILSWLFGVSTQEELEHVKDHVEKLSTETRSIVHAMEVHASLIHERLWETKAVADTVVELQTAFAQVENEAKKIDQKISGITYEIERQRLAAVKVECLPTNRVRDCLDRRVDRKLRHRSGYYGYGKTSGNAFSASTSASSAERHQSDPSGRMVAKPISSGGRHMKSVQRSKMFEFPQSFTLYEVISLPRPVNNSTQGAQFHPLPSFLAVASDCQAFVELTAPNSSRCLSSTTSICPISREINRKQRESSCAMALFLKDDKKSRMQCSTCLAQWTGQQTVYLGHRRWGYSTDQETTITITCPNSRGKTSTLIKREPFDVFEVPMAFSQWIFQASLKKNVRHSLNNESLPSLAELDEVGKVPQERDSKEIDPAIEPEIKNWKHKPLISRRVKTQNHVTLMGKHLRIIEEEEKARRSSNRHGVVRYPVEIIAVVAVLFSSLALLLFLCRHKNQASLSGLTERLIELEKRLASHELEVEDHSIISLTYYPDMLSPSLLR